MEKQSDIVSKLPNHIKDAFNTNFENGMAAYYEYADGDIMPFQRELAHYFAKFKPGRTNIYRDILVGLRNTNMIYSTLNYDLLFEITANECGFPITYSTAEFQNNIRLLKIHGSCNFWPDIQIGMFKNLKVTRSGKADVEAPVKPLSQLNTINRCKIDDSFAPAIAMYTKDKPVKVCPLFVERQLTQWQQAVMVAEKIIIFGVNVNPEDKHIWNYLSQTESPVWYFGLQGDKEKFFVWKDANAKINTFFREAYFRDAIKVMKSNHLP